MREKRMTCARCPRYNREALRCLDGKTNPRKKADTFIVAELLGLRALCHYNPYRDALAYRMYFPAKAATLTASSSKPRVPGVKRIEIEIEVPNAEG